MLKHHIPSQVIAAIFCFCIAGLFLGINAQIFKQSTYYGTFDDYNYSTEDLLMIGTFSFIAITTIIAGIGFLKKKRWAATLMTVMFVLGLALIIISILAMFRDFIRDPADAIIYLFVAIGLPLVALLFFSSTDIFPWLAKEEDDRHHDIIDHF